MYIAAGFSYFEWKMSDPLPQHRPEVNARRAVTMRRNQARMRELRRIARDAMRDFPEMVRRGGPKSQWSIPFCRHVEEDAAALALHLAGEASEVELMIIRDAAIVGASLEVVAAYFIQSGGDLEAASRISSLASSHLKLLEKLGLERRAKELPSLAAYLAQRSESAATPNDPSGDPSEPASPRHCSGDLRRVEPAGTEDRAGTEPEDAALVEPAAQGDTPQGAKDDAQVRRPISPVEAWICEGSVLGDPEEGAGGTGAKARSEACTPAAAPTPRSVRVRRFDADEEPEAPVPLKVKP